MDLYTSYSILHLSTAARIIRYIFLIIIIIILHRTQNACIYYNIMFSTRVEFVSILFATFIINTYYCKGPDCNEMCIFFRRC